MIEFFFEERIPCIAVKGIPQIQRSDPTERLSVKGGLRVGYVSVVMQRDMALQGQQNNKDI